MIFYTIIKDAGSIVNDFRLKKRYNFVTVLQKMKKALKIRMNLKSLYLVDVIELESMTFRTSSGCSTS